MPRVYKYLPAEFRAAEKVLEILDMVLFEGVFSCGTFGELFWPRAHIDVDAFYCVIVCVEGHTISPDFIGPRECVFGGEFTFPALGHALEISSGDVFVFNPYEFHGTAEIRVSSSNASRVMCAFFCKKGAIHTAANLQQYNQR